MDRRRRRSLHQSEHFFNGLLVRLSSQSILASRSKANRPFVRLAFTALILLAATACRDEPPSSAPVNSAPAGTRVDVELLNSTSPLSRAANLAEAGRHHAAARLLAKEAPSLPIGERVRAHEQRALYLLHAGADSSALAAAEEARSIGTLSADGTWLFGELCRRRERSQEAERLLRGLLEQSPDHAGARLSLARLVSRVHSPKESLPLFDAWIEKASPEDPLQVEGRLDYGRALYRAGQAQRAVDELARLIEDDPGLTVAYHELASAYYRLRRRPLGKFAESLFKALSQNAFEEHVAEGLRASGRESLALSQAALQEGKRGRLAAALRLHRRASALGQGDSRVAIYHADACLQVARPTEALRVLDAVEASAGGLQSGLARARGDALLQAYRVEEAARSFADAIKALEQEGDAGGVARGQADPAASAEGLARARQGDRPQGTEATRDLHAEVKSLRSAIDGKPFEDCADAYHRLALLLLKLGDASAVDLLRLASDLAPQRADFAWVSARSITDQGRVFVRLHFARRALRADPAHRPAAMELASIYLQLQMRAADALQLARLADSVQPDPQSCELLARALAATGATDAAREQLERGLRAWPGDVRLPQVLRGLSADEP